jgi:hypothetical protein
MKGRGMSIPGVYGLWNLLWPVGLIAGVVWLVRRYRRWADGAGLAPAVRRRVALGALGVLVAYCALRPAVPFHFAQFIWPRNVMLRAINDFFMGGQALGWDGVMSESGLEFPQSAWLRAADAHYWLAVTMHARVTVATADLPELIASRPELGRVWLDESPWLATGRWGMDPLWWDPAPNRADEIWAGSTDLHDGQSHLLTATVHHGWFDRSTVFVDSVRD